MNWFRPSSLVLLFLVSSFPGRGAFAEGCENGYRAWKPSELEFFRKAQALAASLPPAPKGWQVKDGPAAKDDVPDRACIDDDPGRASGKRPLRFTLTRDYERMDLAERQKQLAANMEAMQKEPSPADQKKIDALNAKAEAAQAKMVAALEKQDSAAITKYSEEYQKYAGEALAIETGGLAQLGEAQTKALRDTAARVQLIVNELSWASNMEHPAPLSVKGAAGAWREVLDRPKDSSEPSSWTTVVFGRWQNRATAGDPYLRLEALDRAPGGTKLQTLWVRIEAEPATADLLLKGLDTGKLRAAVPPAGPVP